MTRLSGILPQTGEESAVPCRPAQLSEAALNHHAAVMVGIFIAIDAATPLMMPIIAAAKAGLALPAANTERNVGLRDV